MVDPDKLGPFAIPAVIVLATALSFFPAISMALFAAIGVKGMASAVAFAACWTATEWLRGHLFTGFPWNLAGYAVADYAAFRQAAALVGSYGLSFLVILAAVLPVAVLGCRRRDLVVTTAFLVSLIASVWVFGELRLARTETENSGVQVRIVQGNVPQREKWQASKRGEILNRYVSLSAQQGAPDLILWPESAFPGLLDEDRAAQQKVLSAMPKRTMLLTGVPARVQVGSQIKFYNSVQAYLQGYGLIDSYAKHHLVPFGEYVPFRNWLPFDRMVGGTSDFSAGPGPRTLYLRGLPPVGIAICYEIIFPGHVIDRTQRPAWIFNATNDAWFGASIGPEQHLASARMRAVEEGLPVIRAANTGISAVIDANGRVIDKLGMQETGTIDALLPSPLRPTLYAWWGDWNLLLLIAAASLLAFLGPRRAAK